MRRTPLLRKTPLRAKTPMKARSPMKAQRKPPVPAAIKAHWDRVRALGCIVTGRPNPTLHHVHGGSMALYLRKGGGLKTSDWLVIPLCLELHAMDPEGIDAALGVKAWEAKYGTQLFHLQRVCILTGTDVLALAGIDAPAVIAKFPEES